MNKQLENWLFAGNYLNNFNKLDLLNQIVIKKVEIYFLSIKSTKFSWI